MTPASIATTTRADADDAVSCPSRNYSRLRSLDAKSLKQNLGRKDAKIMIIDDEPLVIRVLRRVLQTEGYSHLIELTDSSRAMELIDEVAPDVLLLDINMPDVTGLDILRARQEREDQVFTPIIILSADSETETKREALQLGATEFLQKPVDPTDLILRVQNALIVKAHQNHLTNYAEVLEREVELRTRELVRSHEQIVHCLARAAEFRDNETGQHVVRVGKFARIIAEELGMGEDFCQRIELAAQLHDVGKIGVPDAILMNPNKLTDEEMKIMTTHCELGGSIIRPLAHQDDSMDDDSDDDSDDEEGQADSLLGLTATPLMQMAMNIALTHHEKWDGTGYPRGLKGGAIPIEGRITSVADVFDALSSERPYKSAFTISHCLELMRSEEGERFEPRIFQAFLNRLPDIIQVKQTYI